MRSKEEKVNARETQLSRKEKTFGVLRVIKNIVCWSLIIVLAFLVITFLLNRVSGITPSLFGYTVQRVSTGSMQPELMVGDVILSKNVGDVMTLEVDDIITFKGGSQFGNDVNVTHRVVVAPQEENGTIMLQTKGDANDVADNPISADRVQSKYICTIGFLSKLYELFLSPWGLVIFIALLLFIFFDELINIIRIATHTLPEDKEESIGEIIERLQREDAEKAERERQREEQISRDMVEIMANSEKEEQVRPDED